MPTTAQTFYPSATDQDDTWGTDVRKLLETVPALNSTTICTHANAAGTTQITLDPYTNSSTASDVRTNFGWAVNQAGADGMGSLATAKRTIPAGVWTFTNRVTLPQAGAVTGTLTASLLINVYRVGASPTYTRTLLFSATSNTFQTTGLSIGGATGTITANSASQPLILLQAGETIHVGYLSNLVQVAGALGATVSGVATYHTGVEGGVNISVATPAPGVRTRYLLTISAIGVGVFLAFVKKIKKTFTSSGVGVVTITRKLSLHRTISATGTGLVTISRKLTIRRRIQATGQGLVRIFAKLPIGKIPSGGGTIVKKVITYIFED